MSPLSLRDLAPLRIVIGADDVTPYVDESFTFSSVDPGGFEACSLPFPRDLPQTLRGQPVRITAGLRTAWEGRVSQIQRSLGHKTTVMGEGYGALLKDATASMVFVDRDLTRWQQPSYTRQVALAAAGDVFGSFQVGPDKGGNPSLAYQLPSAYNGVPIVEGWYDSGPANLIGKVYYQQEAQAMPASWSMGINSSIDDHASSNTNLLTVGTTPNSGYLTPGNLWRFAYAWATAPNTNNASNAQYLANWRSLTAYGNHGLAGRGSDPVGFYPSDIVGWVLSQVGGLQRGVIQQTDASGYIVPHSVYHLPVTLDTMLADMTTVQGWHWGVWESLAPLTGSSLPRLDFRPRPSPGTFTAACQRQDCETLDIREDLSQQFNAAIVTWTNIDGTQGAVTVTADNPILDQAGIASRTIVLSGGTMIPADAAIFGQEALALTNAQARVAGSANVTAPISLPNGPAPAFLLRPGLDRLRIPDAPSVDAFGATNDFPIIRVECAVGSSGINTSVELGTGSQLVETLNARLAAATFLAGTGG